MIANLSSDADNIEETISTSRFAMRCSLLSNEIKKNERIDLNMVVKKLESENVQLREELEQYRTNGVKPGKGKNESQDKIQNGKKVAQTNQEQGEEQKLTQFEYFEIAANVESYLNDKMDSIQLKNLTEANAYIKAMKDFYCSRMREYIGELNIISHKLKKYEGILSKRRTQNNSKNQSVNSLDYYNDEEITSYDTNSHEGYGIKDSTNEVKSNYGYDSKQNIQSTNVYANTYDKNSKENSYNYQNPNKSQGSGDKKVGFYNFAKTYQTEAIIEAPDEGDY
jgi:kinesin family protein 6/9